MTYEIPAEKKFVIHIFCFAAVRHTATSASEVENHDRITTTTRAISTLFFLLLSALSIYTYTHTHIHILHS